MATPRSHAVCALSAAARWMNCTAAPRFEEQFPDSSTVYADTGTLAHSICELYCNLKLGNIQKPDFEAALEKLKQSPLYTGRLLHCAEFYSDYVMEKANSYTAFPHVAVEVKVDLSIFVPEGFGTCDCVIIGDDRIHITDYKNGQGVVVSPVRNPQMMLYAIGAMEKYRPIYGDKIKRVSMAIVQPNVTEDVQEFEISVEELYKWGEMAVRPAAVAAFTGTGAEFKPGTWCRFCKGGAVCPARAESNTALEEFKDCVPIGLVSPGERTDPDERALLGLQRILTNDEIGDLISRGESLADWLKAMKAYALEQILKGNAIKGYKAVVGKSDRKFDDTDKAIETLLNAGIDRAVIYDYKPNTLAQLEKAIGKKRFAELVGDQIIKPMGAPTLAKESDKRPAYSSAAADFAEVKHNG